MAFFDGYFDSLPYDADWSDEENWNLVTLARIGVKLEEKDFDRLKEVIDSTLASKELMAERQKAKEEFWQHQGESGRLTVDYLVKKHSQLV